MSTAPESEGFFMPAEWHHHARTWMAFPVAPYVIGEDFEAAAKKWGEVANVIARHEPVTMMVDPAYAQGVTEYLEAEVDVTVHPIDDSWMRDIGPTFLISHANELGAVAWTFNGWGGQQWARWGNDAAVAREVARTAGARIYGSTLVNEGGGFHVDGSGILLATDTVQLDPGRNPQWKKADVEAELERMLGVNRVVWLPRGLTADYLEFGTRGHVDMLAAFVSPNTAVVHDQRDPQHPDFAVSQETTRLLHSHGISTIPIEAPTTPPGAELNDWSYINFYVGNGFVLVGTFGQDDTDAAAIDALAKHFPGRVIESVDARFVFACGGGLHCITQQEPGPTHSSPKEMSR